MDTPISAYAIPRFNKTVITKQGDSMNMRVLKMIGLSLVCAVALAYAALAQNGANNPVEGTYNVTATSSELGTVNFVMIMKLDGGKWKVEIKDSPTPLTVTSATVDDTNKITISADAGGTPVTISGKFDKGEIAGEFSAGDIKGTWKGAKTTEAAAEAKPAAALASVATLATFEGTYDAKVTVEGMGDAPFTLVIKLAGNKLVTEVPSGGDLNIVGIDVKETEEVTLSATYQGNPFQLPGKRAGAEMGGKWTAGPYSGTWSAKKK
jgi:hypothetical protein